MERLEVWRNKILGRVMVVFTLLSALAWSQCASANEPPPYQPTLRGQVTVSGNMFLRDGSPWIPHGVGMTGLVLPETYVQKAPQALVIAHDALGLEKLRAAKGFGADVVRFNVSESGLDPESAIYDPTYVEKVITYTKLARSMGFVVILSMQWEPGTGLPTNTGLPDQMARRAWKNLLRVIPPDRGIIVEALNEPNFKGTSDEIWGRWHDGFQGLVNEIRNAGWQGVILLDGVWGAKVLDGAPRISDPLNQLGWSVHVYFDAAFPFATEEAWNRAFGNGCQSAACVVTEWQDSSGYGCAPKEKDQRGLAHGFVSYLEQRHIGVLGWAFDHPDTMMVGMSNDVPTDYEHWQNCRTPGFGNGKLLQSYFRKLNQR